MRWLAIVNRAAGQYRSSRFETRWAAALEKVATHILYTDAAGDARRFASEADGFDGMIVVGGDGTIFEVIAGMRQQSQTLALIPAGRGNCLARDLGLTTIAAGFSALRGDVSKSIDLLNVDIEFFGGGRARHYSASTIAFGYVASVVDRAASFRWAGQYAYTMATVVTRPRLFYWRYAANSVDQALRSCTGIIINNTVHLANYRAFRVAAPDDGQLDILITTNNYLRQTAHNLSILSGLEFYSPGERQQASRISLQMESPQTLMIDGELFPNVGRLSVECIPYAITCRCGAQR